MEWKLERTAPRRVRTDEQMLWANVMRVLARDMKKRSQASPKVFEETTTTYSNFKSNFVEKRLSAEVPLASSPVTTRWRQNQARDLAASSFGEEHSTIDLSQAPTSVLQISPEKETLILASEGVSDPLFTCEPNTLKKTLPHPSPGFWRDKGPYFHFCATVEESYEEPLKTPIKGNFDVDNSILSFCQSPHTQDRGWKENVASKGQVGKKRKLMSSSALITESKCEESSGLAALKNL